MFPYFKKRSAAMKIPKNSYKLRSGGFLEVLKVALPLILSHSCHAVNMFVDRLMLAQHSQEAVAASFTGGLTNFTLSCLFVGTVGYTGTFVAQYEGARHRERIGSAMWQGIWLALTGGLIFLTGVWWAKPLFSLFGHDPAVTAQEVLYFKTLSCGVFVFLLSVVLPCFWTGRGKTSFVLLVSVFITLCNIPFNYLLIFGAGPIPSLGVTGAALGTILSELVGIIIYAAFLFAPSSRKHFNTLAFRLEPDLLKRMLRYGLPNGINLALDLVSFNTFSLVLGCYGVTILEATSITFGINNIAFCPILGISMTASILVGQAIGAENVPLAKKTVRSCLDLVTFYNLLMILLFTVFQDLILAPFVRTGDAAQIETMRAASVMLLFIAGYLFFDGINITLGSSLRGAGDTKFAMYVTSAAGIGLFAVPCVLLYRLGFEWWTLWIVLDAYIIVLAVIFTLRYRQGKWTRMRVIEVAAAPETPE